MILIYIVKKAMPPLVASSITVAEGRNQMPEDELGHFYCEPWQKGEIASEFAYDVVVEGIDLNRGAYGKGLINPKDDEKQLNTRCLDALVRPPPSEGLIWRASSPQKD